MTRHLKAVPEPIIIIGSRCLTLFLTEGCLFFLPGSIKKQTVLFLLSDVKGKGEALTWSAAGRPLIVSALAGKIDDRPGWEKV